MLIIDSLFLPIFWKRAYSSAIKIILCFLIAFIASYLLTFLSDDSVMLLVLTKPGTFAKEWKNRWNNIVRTHLYIVYKALNVAFMNYSSKSIKIILKNMILEKEKMNKQKITPKYVFLYLN